MAIVDFHAHLFSRTYFEALAAQSPLPGTVEQKLEQLVRQAKIELPSHDVREHVLRWIAELDRYDVEQMATFASAPEEIPTVAEACAMSRGRMIPFALVNPKVEGTAEKVADVIDRHAFRGVLIFPALHHFHISGPEADALLAVLDQRRAIVYVHCGILVVKIRDLLGFPRTVDLAYANPLGVIPAANKFPRIRFVIPHFGAGFFREALIAGAQCPNVHVDSSSSNSWIATQSVAFTLRDVFGRALDVFGPSRILFGTDSNTFPAGWREDRYEEQTAALDKLGVRGPALEQILGGNARRLLASS